MGALCGLGEVGARITDDPLELLRHVDAVLDFTTPGGQRRAGRCGGADPHRACHRHDRAFRSDDEARIKAAARHARIVKSGNMSLGVNLLAALVRQAAQALGEDFDIEIVEMHHRHKVDAPSGTALLLGEAAAEGRGIDASRSIRSRDGQTGPRPSGDIGFATLRGGSVVGDHTVIFAGPTSAWSFPTRPSRAISSPAAPSRRRSGRSTRNPASTAWPTCWASVQADKPESNMERLLVLVRHGQSEWNQKNLFTGWRDVGLTELGIEEARAAGRRLKARGFTFDLAYTSALKRAQDTLTIMLEELGQTGLETKWDQALNERDYGDLVGLNKDDARKRWGEEQVHQWRRSYDTAPPGGESLKDTLARALPYYVTHILPDVLSGKRVLVSAHGNSLRALIMAIEGQSPRKSSSSRSPTGVPVVYRLRPDSRSNRRRSSRLERPEVRIQRRASKEILEAPQTERATE
jgi:2,3-bisphosphoglycerate-dependent phosphoglycerate mutase